MNKTRNFKRLLAVLLIISLAVSLIPGQAFAKTREAQPAKVVFFYVAAGSGEDILAKVSDIDELKALSHGRKNGENYSISCTDNLPDRKSVV